MKLQIIPGERFGRYSVVREVEQRNGKRMFLCKCDCGVEKEVLLESLRSGRTQGCGCIRIENLKQRNLKHGCRYTRLYRIWLGMRERCSNPNHKSFSSYGGKGIKVCKDWDDYSVFQEWAINNGYKPDLTIERMNNEENYSPVNCKWATPKEQANNKTNNLKINFKGQTKTLKQWSEVINVDYKTLSGRLERGWSVENAFTQPLKIQRGHNDRV